MTRWFGSMPIAEAAASLAFAGSRPAASLCLASDQHAGRPDLINPTNQI
tara:strand:- start:2802 stop:2948 length:147 start_codon:yes stop_codon:yes gene_type:complete